MALAPSWLLVSYSSWTLNKVLLCYSHQKYTSTDHTLPCYERLIKGATVHGRK